MLPDYKLSPPEDPPFDEFALGDCLKEAKEQVEEQGDIISNQADIHWEIMFWNSMVDYCQSQVEKTEERRNIRNEKKFSQ